MEGEFREVRLLQIMVGVVTSVVSALLVSAILVFAQTGLWVFEELLCYFVQLVQQLD